MVMSGIADWLESHMLPCLNKSLFGIECPGCGIQRAFVFLLRGDLKGAWDMYPPLFPIMLTLILLVVALKWDFRYRLTLLKGSFFLSVGFIIVNYILKIT